MCAIAVHQTKHRLLAIAQSAPANRIALQLAKAPMDPSKNQITQLLRESSKTGKLPDLPSRDRQPLTIDQVTSFAPAKLFKGLVKQPRREPRSAEEPARNEVTSICFSDSGDYCTVAGQDDYFTMYDVKTGKKYKYFASQKYGVDHITSTHHTGNVLHASTKGNHDVRYHSAHDNKYLKYFKGHTDKVCSISMSPVNSTFLTGSFDETVLFWDLRTDRAMGKLKNMDGHCLTAWDGTGKIFAVAVPQKQIISLYSVDAFDKKPFAWVTIDDPGLDRVANPRPPILMTSLEFSNNGKYILVGCATNVHYVLEAFTLQIVARLEGHVPLGFERKGVTRSGAEVCWTPDSRYVLAGDKDNRVCIWDLNPKAGHTDLVPPIQPMPYEPGPRRPATTLPTLNVMNENKEAGESARVVKFNPRYAMFASAGVDAALWLPRKDAPEEEEDANQS